jgi:nucleoside-diphosphate-sugar epimerase
LRGAGYRHLKAGAKPKMKTALVTGGSGYFGSLLVQKLHERGYPVRIFDLCKPDGLGGGVEFQQGDIRDAAAVNIACRDAEYVFHNVAQVPLAKDSKLFWSVNRDGTRNLLEASLAQRVRKVIYTSSSAVYGVPKTNPVTEKTQPSPGEDYGRAKLAGEKLCRESASQGLDVSIIRPRTILGHGRLGLFQILFEWIYQGKNIPVLDGGKNIYQFVHADDLAEACILAGEKPGAEDYNCGTNSFGTMREALENLCRHAGTGSRLKSLPMSLIEPAMNISSALGLSPLGTYHSLMYGRSMYFDVSKAMAELNWTPRYSNNTMFIDSYDWYVRHREVVLKSSADASRHKSPVKQGILALVQKFL